MWSVQVGRVCYILCGVFRLVEFVTLCYVLVMLCPKVKIELRSEITLEARITQETRHMFF